MPLIREPLTAEELVQAVRVFSLGGRGERFTIKTFSRETGIPESQIYRHFTSWSQLREAAGLEPHLRFRPWFTEEELLREFHGVMMKLRRIPSCHEFGQQAKVSWQLMHRRFGGKRQILKRYREWLDRKVAELREPKPAEPPRHVQAPRLEPGRDVAWVRQKWQNLKVGFELRSSDVQGLRPDDCDLLIVLEHDWKACPFRVLELRQVLLPGEIGGGRT